MPYLVDKSALARMPDARVQARLVPIIEAGEAATCAIIDLEVLHSTTTTPTSTGSRPSPGSRWSGWCPRVRCSSLPGHRHPDPPGRWMGRIHQYVRLFGHQNRRQAQEQVFAGLNPAVADLPAFRWRRNLAPTRGQVGGAAHQFTRVPGNLQPERYQIARHILGIDMHQVLQGGQREMRCGVDNRHTPGTPAGAELKQFTCGRVWARFVSRPCHDLWTSLARRNHPGTFAYGILYHDWPADH